MNNKKRLKKPLYGGFLPLTGPAAKCASILRRAHFSPHHFVDVNKMVGIVFFYSLPSSA